MTAIHWHAIRSRPRHHNAVVALGDAWSNVAATFREWRRRAHDRTELARLDNRMLQDIGLTRGDAEFLINKPFWRE